MLNAEWTKGPRTLLARFADLDGRVMGTIGLCAIALLFVDWRVEDGIWSNMALVGFPLYLIFLAWALFTPRMRELTRPSIAISERTGISETKRRLHDRVHAISYRLAFFSAWIGWLVVSITQRQAPAPQVSWGYMLLAVMLVLFHIPYLVGAFHVKPSHPIGASS